MSNPNIFATHEEYRNVEGMCRNEDCSAFEETQNARALVTFWNSGDALMVYTCELCGIEVEEDYEESVDWDSMGKALREEAL